MPLSEWLKENAAYYGVNPTYLYRLICQVFFGPSFITRVITHVHTTYNIETRLDGVVRRESIDLGRYGTSQVEIIMGYDQQTDTLVVIDERLYQRRLQQWDTALDEAGGKWDAILEDIIKGSDLLNAATAF